MANYTIKDLEKLSGIKAHTIRIWEKRYRLIEPMRTSTNIRTYCDFDLKRLMNISMLNRNGVKISAIAKLSQDEINEKINHLQQKATDAESQVESLAICMIDLDEDKFEKILTRSIIQMGFEDTVIRVIYPFFIRVGLMWQTGTINPAREHFVSNLIRQKLIVAIDSQMFSVTEKTKKFLLFLPEGEMHELGLLFFSYLIRKRGHKVIYLGQSVPMTDVEEIVKTKKVDHIITSFVSSFNGKDIHQYIDSLARSFSEANIFISGGQTENLFRKLPSNVKIISSPVEFIQEMNSLN
jgi:MerR family transcriptional regulator, light-induced transcriptional regulator